MFGSCDALLYIIIIIIIIYHYYYYYHHYLGLSNLIRYLSFIFSKFWLEKHPLVTTLKNLELPHGIPPRQVQLLTLQRILRMIWLDGIDEDTLKFSGGFPNDSVKKHAQDISSWLSFFSYMYYVVTSYISSPLETTCK